MILMGLDVLKMNLVMNFMPVENFFEKSYITTYHKEFRTDCECTAPYLGTCLSRRTYKVKVERVDF